MRSAGSCGGLKLGDAPSCAPAIAGWAGDGPGHSGLARWLRRLALCCLFALVAACARSGTFVYVYGMKTDADSRPVLLLSRERYRNLGGPLAHSSRIEPIGLSLHLRHPGSDHDEPGPVVLDPAILANSNLQIPLSERAFGVRWTESRSYSILADGIASSGIDLGPIDGLYESWSGREALAVSDGFLDVIDIAGKLPAREARFGFDARGLFILWFCYDAANRDLYLCFRRNDEIFSHAIERLRPVANGDGACIADILFRNAYGERCLAVCRYRTRLCVLIAAVDDAGLRLVDLGDGKVLKTLDARIGPVENVRIATDAAGELRYVAVLDPWLYEQEGRSDSARILKIE